MPQGDITQLPPNRERLLLYTLSAVQFTLIMDYVIMMPLGSHLMRAFGISPAQFGFLIAVYGISAGVSASSVGSCWIALIVGLPF